MGRRVLTGRCDLCNCGKKARLIISFLRLIMCTPFFHFAREWTDPIWSTQAPAVLRHPPPPHTSSVLSLKTWEAMPKAARCSWRWRPRARPSADDDTILVGEQIHLFPLTSLLFSPVHMRIIARACAYDEASHGPWPWPCRTPIGDSRVSGYVGYPTTRGEEPTNPTHREGGTVTQSSPNYYVPRAR